jgi:DNA-binding transcriptional ArsR family regulator
MHVLEDILGSRLNISILRYLTAIRVPLSGNEIATRLGLQQSSVRKALERLVDARVLTRTDVGRSAAYAFNHDLAFQRSVLVPLFQAEARLRDDLLERVANVSRALKPKPRAVILFGSLARGARDFRDVDLLLVVSSVRERGVLEEAVAEAFSALESEFQTPVNPLIATESDLRGKLSSVAMTARRDGLLLAGKPPQVLEGVKTLRRISAS